jgi:hypothetical protein
MLRSLSSLWTCAAAAAAILLATSSFAQEAPRKIAIQIEGNAEFDVIHRRALGSTTGANLGAVVAGALGGLIGAGVLAGSAGIEAGVQSAVDAEKRDAIYLHVAEQAWRDFFIRSLTDSLAEKGLETVWIDAGTKPRAGTADIYMVLYPARFGFRMVDTTSLMMASFIEFEAAYSTTPISGKSKSMKEPFYLTDQTQVSYDQLIADPEGINPRIESVLRKAARRLTNKLYYNVK